MLSRRHVFLWIIYRVREPKLILLFKASAVYIIYTSKNRCFGSSFQGFEENGTAHVTGIINEMPPFDNVIFPLVISRLFSTEYSLTSYRIENDSSSRASAFRTLSHILIKHTIRNMLKKNPGFPLYPIILIKLL